MVFNTFYLINMSSEPKLSIFKLHTNWKITFCLDYSRKNKANKITEF